jgi:hypothetical protein
MRALVILALLLPVPVIAAEYDLTRPVWEQRAKLNCVIETWTQCALQGRSCSREDSDVTPLPWELDFTAKAAGPKGGGVDSQRKIVSEVLAPYPTIGTAVNSLLLDDGRVFQLMYNQQQSKGAFYLTGYLLGASSHHSVSVHEFNCF